MEQDKKNMGMPKAGLDENGLGEGGAERAGAEKPSEAAPQEDGIKVDNGRDTPAADSGTGYAAGAGNAQGSSQKIQNGKPAATLADEEPPEPREELQPEGEEDKESDAKKPKKRRHPVLRALAYTVCVLLVSALLAAGILYSVTDYLGLFRPEAEANVEIPSGASVSKIADILKDEGIIRSPLVFKAYMAITKKQGLKDGTYPLNSHMSYSQIIRTLRSTKNRATVTVTIPEGYTLGKIAQLLEEKSVCSRSDFLKSADSASIEFDFQSEIKNDNKRFYRLEGYLFPDTYEFYVNQSSDSVVKKMVANFDKRFDGELREKAKESGMTVDEIVTLASIIQTESSKTSEMKTVSSVFHNRLKKGVNGVKMLQSDATVLYAKNSLQTSRLSAKEQIASGYNTYEVEGLPTGPICNPGLAAIKAALSPANTSYYFFVSDKDGNYYYAKTYAQHLRNIKKAQKVGEAGGTDTKKNS